MAKGSGGAGSFNINSTKSMDALNKSGGQMSPSFAKQNFPIGSQIEFTDFKGNKSKFEITGYTRTKYGALQSTEGRSVIPKVKRLSGSEGIINGKETVKSVRDLAFSAAIGRSVNLKTKLKITKKKK